MGESAVGPVGLIGVGLLGSAIAERLLGGGFRVLGFDVDAARLEGLAALGGDSARSATEVAARCRRVVLCLPNSDIAAGVVREIDGELASGHLLIDATTGDPEIAAERARSLSPRGVGAVDASVAGSSAVARDGKALVLVGGETSAVATAAPILQCFASRVMHVGPAGAGSRMKLVVNLVLGLNRAVLAEGLAYAKRTGLDAGAALDALRASVAYSRAMDDKGEKMVRGEFEPPQARLAQHLKDVRLILESGARAGAKLPLSGLHREILEALVAAGLGDVDNSAVIRAFE